MTVVLAIDPSLRSTGWATRLPTPSGGHRHLHDTIRPVTTIGGRTHALRGEQRLTHIAARIRRLADRHRPALVVLEDMPHGARSSSSDEIHGLHWMTRAALTAGGYPWIPVNPSTLKIYATGHAWAPKRSGPDRRGQHREGMVDALRDRVGLRVQTDDEADALFLHSLACDAIGQPYVPRDRLHPRADEAIATVVGRLPALHHTPTRSTS